MQVKNHIIQRIDSKEYAGGTRIPSERELCELFAVSRTTIRRAIDELVNENMLMRLPGKGTYVRPDAKTNHKAGPHTGNILFIRCFHSDPDSLSQVQDGIFYPKVLNGLEQAASAHGYRCMYKTIDERKLDTNSLNQITGSVDGIVCGETYAKELLMLLLNTGLPIVLVSPSISTTEADIVDIDNVGGAVSAINYLVQHGRTAIAYIGGPPHSIPALLRKQGCETALKDIGLPLNPDHVSFSGWRFEDGYSRALDLMAEPNRPDAIFAASDLIAIGAMSAVRERGLSVPEDVAIIGFDDIDMAKDVRPSLTTVRVDKEALGRTAFYLLYQRINGQRDFSLRVTLPTTLVERETVNPGNKKTLDTLNTK